MPTDTARSGGVWKNNGLTIVLMLLFLGSLAGHLLTGWQYENADLAKHGEAPITLIEYAVDPHFISTVFENWESEFLQMSAYVVLTTFLFQRGSAESADPDDHSRDGEGRSITASKDAALGQWLYAHSLGLALLTLFVASFVLHWVYSAKEAAADAIAHGETPLSTFAYLGDAQLWFESFQNWQSEFLSTAALVVLSIFLRQRGSPESKPVDASNAQTGS